jgi:hypothetical protein
MEVDGMVLKPQLDQSLSCLREVTVCLRIKGNNIWKMTLHRGEFFSFLPQLLKPIFLQALAILPQLVFLASSLPTSALHSSKVR